MYEPPPGADSNEYPRFSDHLPINATFEMAVDKKGVASLQPL